MTTKIHIIVKKVNNKIIKLLEGYSDEAIALKWCDTLNMAAKLANDKSTFEVNSITYNT